MLTFPHADFVKCYRESGLSQRGNDAPMDLYLGLAEWFWGMLQGDLSSYLSGDGDVDHDHLLSAAAERFPYLKHGHLVGAEWPGELSCMVEETLHAHLGEQLNAATLRLIHQEDTSEESIAAFKVARDAYVRTPLEQQNIREREENATKLLSECLGLPMEEARRIGRQAATGVYGAE